MSALMLRHLLRLSSVCWLPGRRLRADGGTRGDERWQQELRGATHVLLEKPGAPSVGELEAMAVAAEATTNRTERAAVVVVAGAHDDAADDV